ncbi:MAG: division/cell wall cluster transcriptional repressor MraZ [Elusimicrobia bacterium]|nr:division/cell wall cluster transcriptional repressor MraZ [Elusimicrobiota bacterium]
MSLLIGRYEYTLDTKNRLSVPPKFREMLVRENGKEFFLASGQEGCLYLFLPSEWEKLPGNLQFFAMKDKEKERAYTRKFFAEAMEAELDTAGRILIPEYLKKHAGLSSRVLVHGAGNRAEIWDHKKWNSYTKSKVEPTYRSVSKTQPI